MRSDLPLWRLPWNLKILENVLAPVTVERPSQGPLLSYEMFSATPDLSNFLPR